MSNITAATKLCAVIGDPVEHSLSPKMHNAAFKEKKIDNQYVYTAFRVQKEHLKEAINGIRALGIHSLACTIPHKTNIIPHLDYVDPIAQKIGAVNTILNTEGKLSGYNTDWLGVVTPIEKLCQIHGKKAALIGAGGAARALAYAMIEKGAILTIYNRTPSKAKALAKEVGADAQLLDNIEKLSDADIILNSTSLGMGEDIDNTPVPERYLNANQIVFDAVYIPYTTRLLREAQAKGATCIHGIEMLLYQGIAQFELYTGLSAPEHVMRQTLLKHFGISE